MFIEINQIKHFPYEKFLTSHHKESLTKTIPDAVGYVTKKRLITQFCAHSEVHLSFGENIKIDQLYQK